MKRIILTRNHWGILALWADAQQLSYDGGVWTGTLQCGAAITAREAQSMFGKLPRKGTKKVYEIREVTK